MLIQDCTLLDNIQILSENTGPHGTMKIRGVFQRADEQNANKRVYKKALLENSISKIKPLLEGRMFLGELDHPEASIVSLSKASHLVTSLKMKGNEMIGEAEVLNTPAGKIVQTLIKDGVRIGISSRGTGTVTENKDGVKEVNEDFRLLAFDIVADPSTRGAYPQLAESKKVDMQDTLKRTFGEKVFVTLLKENLSEGSMGLKRLFRKRETTFQDRPNRLQTGGPPKEHDKTDPHSRKLRKDTNTKIKYKFSVQDKKRPTVEVESKNKREIIKENLKILLRVIKESDTPTTQIDTDKEQKKAPHQDSSYWVRQHKVAKKFGYESAAKLAKEKYFKAKAMETSKK